MRRFAVCNNASFSCLLASSTAQAGKALRSRSATNIRPIFAFWPSPVDEAAAYCRHALRGDLADDARRCPGETVGDRRAVAHARARTPSAVFWPKAHPVSDSAERISCEAALPGIPCWRRRGWVGRQTRPLVGRSSFTARSAPNRAPSASSTHRGRSKIRKPLGCSALRLCCVQSSERRRSLRSERGWRWRRP
jgi:hypothetical protein